jgi:tetratricopeptide (TPR) repeat protein
MKSVRLLFALVVSTAAIGLAPRASAEDVVLATGARYDARDLEWNEGTAGVEGRIKFTYAVGGGSVTLEFPMSRIDPWSLLALKSARTPAKDGAGQLTLAKFALAHGLPAEASRRFRRAAELDPTLVAERDAGLRAVADVGLASQLAQAERDLKRGRSDLALAAADEVAAKADPSGGLVDRAKTLAGLASRMLETDRVRLAAEMKARADAAAAAQVQAFASGLARADKAIRDALADRAHAGDATLSASEATRALESAESRLREGRRVLAATRPSAGDRVAEIDGRDKEALPLLVATQLDLADLYRQQRRFDKARDFLRAAQVLDPDNARIKEIRELVERDLNAPPPQDERPDAFSSGFYGGGLSTGTYYGGVYYPGLGSPCPCPTPYARPIPYVTPGFRSGFGYRWNRGGFTIRFGW